MKTSYKVISLIFVLGFAVLTIMHVFLQYGLTKTMREVVLPRIKQETGLDVRVGRLSINVAGGRLFLKDVSIMNPEGFLTENLASVDRIEMVVDIPSLFRQRPLKIAKVELDNGVLNVIRNKDGELNLDKLQERLPVSGHPSPDLEPVPKSGGRNPESRPWPELLVKAVQCSAKVRYVDMNLEAVDFTLALNADGQDLSTRRDFVAPWGKIALTGSLGNDQTHFITDLNLQLAPVADPKTLSFDLTGKVLEIDPRIMKDAYDRLGIRSAPFGIDPLLHCRNGRFENSKIALNLRDIQLEDKLANQLGGMASIDSLRFAVPVEGTLQKPDVDFQSFLKSAVGGNAKSLLGSFLKGAAAKEAGLDKTPDTVEEGLKGLGRKLFGK